MKKYTALDLVLIPSEQYIDSIIDYNRRLPDTVLKLGKKETIPHVSISMCRAEDSRINQLVSKLRDYLEILDLSELSSLNISSVYKHNINTVGWNVELNNSLTGLHQSVCALMKNYHFDQMEEENNEDFYVIHENMPFSGIAYLNQFFDKNAYHNYQPHITLGQGEATICEEWVGETMRFDRLSLYHMGTGCTCEKELWSIPLDNNY